VTSAVRQSAASKRTAAAPLFFLLSSFFSCDSAESATTVADIVQFNSRAAFIIGRTECGDAIRRECSSIAHRFDTGRGMTE